MISYRKFHFLLFYINIAKSQQPIANNAMTQQIHSLLDGLSPKRYILPLNNQYSFLNRKGSSKQVNSSLQKYSQQLSLMLQMQKLPRIGKKIYSKNSIDTVRSQIRDLKAILQQQNKQKMLEQKIQQKISEFSLFNKSPYTYLPIGISQFGTPIINNDCANCPKCIKTQKIQDKKQNYGRQFDSNKDQQISKSRNTQNIPNQSMKNRQSKQQAARKLPKIPKMRKYAIAVYFSLYFPNFAQKFTMNRYRHFKQHYLKTQGAPIIQCSNFLRKTLLRNIDIPKIILDYKAKKIEKIQLGQKNEKKNKPILQKSRKNINDKAQTAQSKRNQLQQKKKRIKINQESIQDNFIDNVVFFMNSLLSELYPILTNKKLLVKIYPLLSVGILNCSFLMDNLLMPRELDAIKFQLVKGYMIATQQKQRLLLMNLLITKILIGHVLFKKQTNGVWATAGEISQNQWQHLNEVVQTAASLMYYFCMEIFEDFLKKDNQNTSSSLFIENLSNSLTKCVYSDLKSKFKVKASYSINIQKDPKIKKQLNKVRFKQFIVGIPHLQQIQQVTVNNTKIQQVKQQIKSKIMALIEQVHEKLHTESHILFYDQIKAITLNQKHLIKRGNPKWLIKNSQNLQNSYNYSQFLSKNQYSKADHSKVVTTRNLNQETNKTQEYIIPQRLSHNQYKYNISRKKTQEQSKLNSRKQINLPSLHAINLKSKRVPTQNKQNQQRINMFPSNYETTMLTPLTNRNYNLISFDSSREAPNKYTTSKEVVQNKSVNHLQKYHQLMKKMKNSQKQVHH